MQNYTRDTIEYKGHTIKIVQDSDPQNPRTEWDNLGTMVCWHRRYHLGDMENSSTPVSNNYDTPDELFAEIAGIDTNSDYCERLADSGKLSQYLYDQANKKAVILPLYLYDHSGITMSTGSFSDAWDSGQVGYIYVMHEKIRKEYSWKVLTAKRIAKIREYLTNEVKTYDEFLTGDVWGYMVEDAAGDVTDSCWGYYGDEGIKDAIDEAKSIADYNILSKLKKHLDQLKTWIKNKVPLIYRTPLQLAV